MPGPCITCHGGRGDALTPPDASGKPRFNLLQNAVSRTRGDMQGQLPPFEVDGFEFSTTPGFTRAEQEAALKTINRMILCSYPLPAPSTAPEDACRRPASSGEWQGTAAALVKASYGGDGLPNPAYADVNVPASWPAAGQTTLYATVIAPSCRTCHIMRGTGMQSDIDFTTYEKFQSYADRTHANVVDRGNMPLAKIVYDAFYASSGEETLATFLGDQGFAARDAGGNPLRPGRPIADPGPDRVLRQGATRLSGTGSLYANSYAWSIVSVPTGALPATLTDANTAQPTFNAASDGTYVLSLVVGNGSAQSAPKLLTLVVNNAFTPAPSAIRFADIKAILQDGTKCQGCHSPASPLPRADLLHERGPQRRWRRRQCDGRRLVLRRGAQPDQFHGARREPAAAQALGPPSPRRPRRRLRHAAWRPGNRRARITTCSSTGSSTARRSSAFGRDQ